LLGSPEKIILPRNSLSARKIRLRCTQGMTASPTVPQRCGGVCLASASLLVFSLLALGCGSSPQSGGGQPNEPAALSGKVFGGQQPINGAAISFYAAGAAGPGAGALSLLHSPVSTYSDGGFSITSDYVCPSSTAQVYIVARGGDSGLSGNSDNQASVLMAALGDCGSLSADTFVQVNEVTTVASTWALAQFMAAGGVVGASPNNATGLRNAFGVANNLVNLTTGKAGGALLPSGAVVEADKLDSLANLLASCVNSDGGSACNPLFQVGTVNGNIPSNTLDAALNIVHNPASNVLAIFNATPTDGAFDPQLTQAPSDWTMTLTFQGGGLNEPTDLAIDSTGSVWVANYFGAVASKFDPSGNPISLAGFTDPSLHESYGIAVDSADNVWITNDETTNGVNGGLGSITKFSSSGQLLSGTGISGGGIFFPYSIAADSNGDMWVADYGNSGVSLLSPGGSSVFGTAGLSPAGLAFPTSIAVDANHNGWLTSEGTVVRVAQNGAATSINCGCFPSAITIDPSGNVWLAAESLSVLYEMDTNGTILQTLSTGGISSPQTIAIDGAGSVWAANFHGKSVSGFSATHGGVPSMALSPASGFGRDISLASPYGIAIDASGNLWTSSYSDNSLTEFVGLASPVKTPLLGPPAQP
jgi:streptogramin lyase